MGHATFSLRRTTLGLLGSQKIRFGLVGLVNTATDFAVLLSLVVVIGIPTTLANIISTSIALAVSYMLNKKAVFGNADGHNRRQIMLFIIVTLTGLWVIQTLVIVTTSNWLQVLIGNDHAAIVLIIAKIIATVISLIWNYLWYSRVVFRKKAS
jgi:putative flippase GtrA